MNAPAPAQRDYARIGAGDPAPWFHQRCTSNPRYAFDTTAGRYIVLCFYGSAADPQGRAALDAALAKRDRFDDERACFFGVSLDRADETEARARESLPGVRHFWDFDGAVSRLYGVIPRDATDLRGSVPMLRSWMVLDPTLRVMKVIPFAPDGSDRAAIFDYLDQLAPPGLFAGFEVPAPVLVLPNVFEPELCRRLIELYDAHGGEESGFMSEVDGKTVKMHDPGYKRRRDYEVEDKELLGHMRALTLRRITPEILKVYNFKATRMERYIVSCYAATDGGHFRAHRDNTTKGTAHRRFAVSINLNAEFRGGEVSFPEYGKRSYKAPPGGAVIFPCGLLHAVSQVIEGRRYAFLPFLYDEEAAKVREANNAFLGEGVEAYKTGTA